MPKNKNKTSPLTKPLTKRRFKKELGAATRSQFKPLQRELQKQTRISKLQSQRTSRYFRDYQQAIGRGRTETQGVYDQAQASMGNYAAAAGSQDAALRAQLGQQAGADSALYGGSGDTAAAGTALAGQANRVRAGGDVAGAIAGQGANTFGYLSSQKANAKLGKAEALTAEARNRAQISDDMMALMREKADFRTEYLAQAREGERRYELALKELRNANKQAGKDRKLTRGQNAKDRNLTQSENAKDRNQSAQETKDGSKSDRRKALNKASALLGGYKNPDEIVKNPKSAIAGLVNEGIPAGIARRAVKQYVSKHKGGGGKGGTWGWGNDGLNF